MYKLCVLLVALGVFFAAFMTTINDGYWLGCTLTLGMIFSHPIICILAILLLAFIVFLF